MFVCVCAVGIIWTNICICLQKNNLLLNKIDLKRTIILNIMYIENEQFPLSSHYSKLHVIISHAISLKYFLDYKL